MSQHDMDVANGAGVVVRADINAGLQALASSSSGSSAPSPSFPCQLWADTGASRLKRRNAANSAWLDEGPLDAALRDAASQGGFVADTGVANAYVCNFVPALTVRSESTPLRFKVANANTAASTINDGIGTVDLVGATQAALVGGELIANGIAWIQWNATTGAYVLLFCTGAAGSAVNQVQTAFTTAGTAPNFTLTPVPAIGGYAAPQRFRVKFNAAAATSGTLNISGLGAKNLKQYDSTGAKVAAIIASGQLADVEYDGTDMVVLDPLPNAPSDLLNTTRINVASAGTVNLTTSAPSTRNINITGTTTITGFTVAAGLAYFVRFSASLTITNGASLVTQSGSDIVTQAGDTCLIRATAANTAEILCYTPFRNQSLGYEQTYQNFTGARVLSTTYTNSTGKPILLVVYATVGSGSYSPINVSINGSAVITFAAGDSPSGQTHGAGTVIVPAGATYNVTTSLTINSWWELR